jgi:putative transposase
MQRPSGLLVPIGRVTTAWTWLPEVVATVEDDLGLWQVCGRGDPGAWVGSVLPWTEHRVALLAQRFRPALYANRLLGATQCSRYSLGRKRNFNGETFWARGYAVSTVGCEEEQIRRYIRNQEQLDAQGRDEDGDC